MKDMTVSLQSMKNQLKWHLLGNVTIIDIYTLFIFNFSRGPPLSPHYAIFGRTKGYFPKLSMGSESLVMTSEGLGEMF